MELLGLIWEVIKPSIVITFVALSPLLLVAIASLIFMFIVSLFRKDDDD